VHHVGYITKSKTLTVNVPRAAGVPGYMNHELIHSGNLKLSIWQDKNLNVISCMIQMDTATDSTPLRIDCYEIELQFKFNLTLGSKPVTILQFMY
jgi:hypothetical protein